jgi:hypothetical protein
MVLSALSRSGSEANFLVKLWSSSGPQHEWIHSISFTPANQGLPSRRLLLDCPGCSLDTCSSVPWELTLFSSFPPHQSRKLPFLPLTCTSIKLELRNPFPSPLHHTHHSQWLPLALSPTDWPPTWRPRSLALPCVSRWAPLLLSAPLPVCTSFESSIENNSATELNRDLLSTRS